MTKTDGDPAAPSAPARTASYSARLRRACYVAALFVALLPIPVTLLHLLPAYPVQEKFLIVYAPLICLLTMAYLFYVRDSLARLMFAHILNPLPPAPVYYPERTDLRLRRLWMSIRQTILTVLPVLLLVGSVVCAMQYLTLVRDSMAVASVTFAQQPAGKEDVGLVPADSTNRSTIPPLLLREEGALAGSGPVSAMDAPTPADIPYFTELTLLYVGSFLTAVVALGLMGLREYAREAIGLTEQDVVLSRVPSE
jgi:hypothetical protein